MVLTPQSLLSFVTLFFLSLTVVHIQSVVGQVLVNGQIFTDGLAIIDAPAPNTYVQNLISVLDYTLISVSCSTLHAGATQSVAIDVRLRTTLLLHHSSLKHSYILRSQAMVTFPNQLPSQARANPPVLTASKSTWFPTRPHQTSPSPKDPAS